MEREPSFLFRGTAAEFAAVSRCNLVCDVEPEAQALAMFVRLGLVLPSSRRLLSLPWLMIAGRTIVGTMQRRSAISAETCRISCEQMSNRWLPQCG